MDNPTIVYRVALAERWIERVRLGIVLASALALILAGPTLPF